MLRQVTNERDATLAAVARDAIQYGSYKTALDNVRQIQDAGVRDSALLALVRDALARGLYDVAIDAAAAMQTDRSRNRALKVISTQAARYGLHQYATRAAHMITVTAPPPAGSGAAARRVSGDSELRTESQTNEDLTGSQNVAVSPASPSRRLPWVVGACTLTTGLWAVGFTLHGANLREWLTTQVDAVSCTAFLMTISSFGAIAYEWKSRRRGR